MSMHAAYAPELFRSATSSIGRIVATWLADVAAGMKNRAALRQLAHADDRMLADIGLVRADLRDAASLSPFRDPTSLLVARSVERRAARPRFITGPRIMPAPALVPDATDALNQPVARA